MKVKVRNILIDSEKEPIMIIFEDDSERKKMIENLSNMEDRDGQRYYMIYPDETPSEEIDKFFNQREFENDDLSYKDRLLRLAADFDNFKKRVSKEREEMIPHIKSSVLSGVLDLDNDLSIALKSIPEKDKDGLDLIISKMDKFLKLNGVETISTDEYNSDLHEVVSVVETGEEKILDVVSKGYKVDGKIIRHPKVILSK